MCGATPITPPKKVSNFLTRLLSIIMGLFSVVPMSDETAQSIGENSVLIFLIIVIFVSILIFLIYKRRKEKEKKKRQEKSKNKP
jgi:preprotein translocase subunit SecG